MTKVFVEQPGYTYLMSGAREFLLQVNTPYVCIVVELAGGESAIIGATPYSLVDRRELILPSYQTGPNICDMLG